MVDTQETINPHIPKFTRKEYKGNRKNSSLKEVKIEYTTTDKVGSQTKIDKVFDMLFESIISGQQIDSTAD